MVARPPSPSWRLGTLACLLALAFLMPTTGAFPGGGDDVAMRYGPEAAPTLFAVGALHMEGRLPDVLVATGLQDVTIGPLAVATLFEADTPGALPLPATHDRVTLVVHRGGLLWYDDAPEAYVQADLALPYGIMAALPGDEGDPTTDPFADGGPAPFLLTGPAMAGTLDWSAETTRLVLFDAEVSLLDATGAALDGWDRRAVLPGMGPGKLIETALGGTGDPAGTTAGTEGEPENASAPATGTETVTQEDLERLADDPTTRAYLEQHGIRGDTVDGAIAEADPEVVDEVLDEVNTGLDALLPPGVDRALLAGIVQVEGPFAAAWTSQTLISRPGPDAALTLTVAPAQEDGFDATVQILTEIGGALTGVQGEGPDEEGHAPAGDDPFASLGVLGPLSGMLNGVTLVLPPQTPEGTPPVAPLEATLDGQAFQAGRFTALRGGTTQVDWSAEGTRVDGDPDFVVTDDGVQVAAPALLGPLPLLAVALWLAAAGAIVHHQMRRPAEAEVLPKYRRHALGVHLVTIPAALVVWDLAFRATFGVSVGGYLLVPPSGDGWATAGAVAGVELLSWTFAYLLFGLPARIGLGIALRHVGRGRGRGWKGYAKAGGLLATIGLGPFYALWTLVPVAGAVMGFLPGA